MDGGAILGYRNNEGNPYKLTLEPSSTFLWHGGSLDRLTIDVLRANATVAGNFVISKPTANFAQRMASTTFNIWGSLKWNDGNVALA